MIKIEDIKEKMAVLIIDMQDYFITDNEAKLALIPKQIKLIEFCRKNDVPVFLIEYCGYGRTTRSLLEVAHKISKENLYFVPKNTWSPFASTQLDQALKNIKAEYLLVSGINACACVYDTLAEANDLGFKTLVSYDLMAGYCDYCLINEDRKHWELSGFEFIEFEAG